MVAGMLGKRHLGPLAESGPPPIVPASSVGRGGRGGRGGARGRGRGGGPERGIPVHDRNGRTAREEEQYKRDLMSDAPTIRVAGSAEVTRSQPRGGGAGRSRGRGRGAFNPPTGPRKGTNGSTNPSDHPPPLPPSLASLPPHQPPGPSIHIRYQSDQKSSTTVNDSPDPVGPRGYRASGTYARVINARGRENDEGIAATPNSINGSTFNREVMERNHLPPRDDEPSASTGWMSRNELFQRSTPTSAVGGGLGRHPTETFGGLHAFQQANAIASSSSNNAHPSEPAPVPSHRSYDPHLSLNSFADTVVPSTEDRGRYRTYSPSRPVSEGDAQEAQDGEAMGFGGDEGRVEANDARLSRAADVDVDMDAYSHVPMTVEPLPLPTAPSSFDSDVAPRRGERMRLTAPELIRVKVERLDTEGGAAMRVNALPLPVIQESGVSADAEPGAGPSRAGVQAAELDAGAGVQAPASTSTRRRQQESAEEVDEIEEEREQKPVVDYSAQVKMEPGTAREEDEIDELEDEDDREAGPGEDDPLRQSGTMAWSRKEDPKVRGCFGPDDERRRVARLYFKLEVIVELSRRFRVPQTFFWRDDGLAVDWTLNLARNKYYHKMPPGMSNQSLGSDQPRWTADMRAWHKRMVRKWHDKYGARYERLGVYIDADYLCVHWRLRSPQAGLETSLLDLTAEDNPNLTLVEPMSLDDEPEASSPSADHQQLVPPALSAPPTLARESRTSTLEPSADIATNTRSVISNRKRGRSPSPEAARKNLRRDVSAADSTRIPIAQTSSNGIIRKSAGHAPVPITAPNASRVKRISPADLQSALDDVAEWTARKVDPATMKAKRWEKAEWPFAKLAERNAHEFLCGFQSDWTSKIPARRTRAAVNFRPDAWYVVQHQSNIAPLPNGLPQIQCRDICGGVNRAIQDMRPAPRNFAAQDMVFADLSSGQAKHRLILASISSYAQYKAPVNGLMQVRVWRYRQTFLLDHKFHKEQNHHEYHIAASVLTVMLLPTPSVETSKALDMWEDLRAPLAHKLSASVKVEPTASMSRQFHLRSSSDRVAAAPAVPTDARVSPSNRNRAISISSTTSSESSDSADTVSSSSSSSSDASSADGPAVILASPFTASAEHNIPVATPRLRPRRLATNLIGDNVEGSAISGAEIMPFEAQSVPPARGSIPNLRAQSPIRDMEIDPDIEESPTIPLRRHGRAGRYRYDSDSDESSSGPSDEMGAPANPGASAALRSCEDRFAELLKLQETWQGIRDLAPADNRSGPNKKLAEIEADIVGVHQQMAAIRSAPPQIDVADVDDSETSSSLAEADMTHRHVEESSDLTLKNGVGRPLNRVAGDRARSILISPDGQKFAPFSMRGCVQVMEKSSTRSVRAQPQASSLSSGVIAVDGCMPTNQVCVLALEKSGRAVSGHMDLASEQVVAAALDPVNGAVTYDFFPAKPHANGPFSIESLGQHSKGYSFVTGGADHTVMLWDVQQRDRSDKGDIRHCQPQSLHTAHSTAVRALAYCETSQYLFSGAKSGGDVAVFDCGANGQRLRRDRFLDVGASIWHIHTNTNQPNIVAVEAELTADQFYTYDLRRSRQPTKRFGYDYNKIVVNGKRASTAGRFEKGSFDGIYFARGYMDGTIRLWDMRMVGRRNQPFQVARATKEPIRGIVVEGSTLYFLTNQLLTTFNFE